MGPRVRLLDSALIDQIAAGEVIERPANLVKELLENAIDAQAAVITVAVEDGGRARVRVSDDGVGMSAADATLSVERHATSKIASFDDLVHVRSLGFRGEALPSIGSVSKMTITTRPRQDLEGTRVIVEGGELRDVLPAGCPPGTTVEVEDLFYNVPARKKFLRARQTETSRIFEVCQRVALSHPELRLRVTSDGRTAREYLPARSLGERARQVFGEIGLHEIHAERDQVTVDAALAPPEVARPGMRHLFLFVNGRPIHDRRLARAIAFAYGDRLPPGHYPRGLVALRLPPEDVDVNAHPQKNEVRFRQASQLLDRVTRMIGARLPSATAGDAYWDARIGGAGPMGKPAPSKAFGGSSEEFPKVAEAGTPYEASRPTGLRYVALVRDRLLVCESSDELLIVDRQKADALLRCEALLQAFESGTLSRQNLLFPSRIELGARERDRLVRDEEVLRKLGFEWSAIGDRSFVIRAIPSLLADAPAAGLFEAALSALEPSKDDRLPFTLRALATFATDLGEAAVDELACRQLVAKIQLQEEAHCACILSRVPLTPPATGTRNE